MQVFVKKKTCQAANSTYTKKELKKVKPINTKSVSPLDMTSEMIRKLRLHDIMLTADIVVIENQPVPKNPTMKSIQTVL